MMAMRLGRAMCGLTLVAGGGASRLGYEAKVEASGFDPSQVSVEKAGESEESLELMFKAGEARISPWHDVPFIAGWSEEGAPLLSFVCEIPLGTRAKMEIHKSLASNPIAQDRHKDGSLRFYAYGDSIVNYGAIAQTWEDPNIADPDTGLGGDNDPVDVLQLNEAPCRAGAIQRVRVIGALALIDGGETDWKLLVVDADDIALPASEWRDVADLPPDRLDRVRDWFRLYKTAEGKPENRYAFDGMPVDAATAIRVARLTHDHWRALVDDKTTCSFKGVSCWVDRAESSGDADL